jgi:hypothetical protein
MIEEILKENETDVTNINLLIYAASIFRTETISKSGKTVKNTRSKESWKIT